MNSRRARPLKLRTRIKPSPSFKTPHYVTTSLQLHYQRGGTISVSDSIQKTVMSGKPSQRQIAGSNRCGGQLSPGIRSSSPQVSPSPEPVTSPRGRRLKAFLSPLHATRIPKSFHTETIAIPVLCPAAGNSKRRKLTSTTTAIPTLPPCRSHKPPHGNFTYRLLYCICLFRTLVFSLLFFLPFLFFFQRRRKNVP